MELEWLVKEFLFDCQARNLSHRTVENYKKQLRYFLDYLSSNHNITTLEDMKPKHLKEYIVTLQRKGNKASYINDLFNCLNKHSVYGYKNTPLFTAGCDVRPNH